MNDLIIIAIRLLVPISILRFPLAGGLASIIADYYDLELLQLLKSNRLPYYQPLDKILDLYYLTFEAFVSSFWTNKLARQTSLSLFFYRFVGLFIFFITQNGLFLVIFPNLFEFFYLFYLSYLKLFKKDPATSRSRLVIILLILLIPKLIHEYMLHINTTYPWTENKYIKMIWMNWRNLFL